MTNPFPDVRGVGFAARASLADACRWIDGATAPLPAEPVPAADALGRVLAEAVTAPADRPTGPRAARDGLAVRAEETLGASAYNPIPLTPNSALPVSAGDSMPDGADAVLPVGSATLCGGIVEVVDPIAPGDGVERPGDRWRAGTTVIDAGRRLGAAELGLLAALGVTVVAAAARPRVRLLLAGGPRCGAESLGAPLAALAARDGGAVESLAGPLPADRDALAAAFEAPGADLIVCAGRTGVGVDDVAPLALANAGRLDLHGLALRPGESAGLGVVDGVPVILLPGEPLAALTVWDLLAGRALRRLAALPPASPYPTLRARTARKLVSDAGTAELYRVRLTGDGSVEPVASAAVPGLAAAVRSDGFVLIPAESEGYPPGAEVTVHLTGATLRPKWDGRG